MSDTQVMDKTQPKCPTCGTPVESTVQHYRFKATPRIDQYMHHGMPGVNILGHVEVQPCGCALSPAEAAEMVGQ